MLRIASWNLNHRTIEKPIPTAALDYFGHCDADLIVLNEYVDGDSRSGFTDSLRAIGFSYQDISPNISNHNQVFVASKVPIQRGDLIAPQFDGSSKTNFLHVVIPSHTIEIVGFRVPAYKRKSERDQYWNLLRSTMESASGRPICFIGDANYDPFRGASANSNEIAFDLAGQYRIPNPNGDWSYISLNGKNKSRIDHAFLSSSLHYEVPEYITTFNGIVLAGSKDEMPITDHAVLAISLSNNTQVEQGAAPKP